MKRLNFFGLFCLFALASCTVDIGDGSQLTGQRCFSESDCAPGLTCYDRVCTPRVGGAAGPAPANNSSSGDTGFAEDTGGGVNNGSPNNENNNTIPPPPVDVGVRDVGSECPIGARRCISDLTYEVCIEVGGGSEFRRVQCNEREVCEDGRCVDVGPMCIDNDGDGYGPGCRRGDDCDDNNLNVNPGLPESCDTPFDDNCNGGVNEGCNMTDCCPDGCDFDQGFCSTACVCEPYDPMTCEFQNQPCFNEGAFDNGFVCATFDGNSEPRCWGICQVNADDPDGTCPDPNTVCAFDTGDGQNGLCMQTCTRDPATGESTGCPGGTNLGCLSVDVEFGDGICAPTNPDNDRGDRCNSDSFFDCDAGLVCVDFGGGPGGRCREGCRPFANPSGTDCDIGHCLPFSESFGICFQDNMSTEGDPCGQIGTACGEDTVGCYPGGQNGNNQCLRLCRLGEGDIDCVQPGQDCNQYDQQQDEIGVCF